MFQHYGPVVERAVGCRAILQSTLRALKDLAQDDIHMPLIFVALGSLPALTGSRRIERLIFLLPLAFAIFLIMFTWRIAAEYVRRPDPYGPEFLLINYIFVDALALSALSVPIDFLWALLARWVARKVSESLRMLPMLISLLICLAAPSILFAIGQPGQGGDDIQGLVMVDDVLSLREQIACA